MKTIKEFLDENHLIYGNKGNRCKKSVKATLRKKGKWRKALEGTTFDEIEAPHGNARYYPRGWKEKK